MNNSSFRHRNIENKGIKEDDKREEVKNLVGKSKWEGLGALPLKKFKKNYAVVPNGDTLLEPLALSKGTGTTEHAESESFRRSETGSASGYEG